MSFKAGSASLLEMANAIGMPLPASFWGCPAQSVSDRSGQRINRAHLEQEAIRAKSVLVRLACRIHEADDLIDTCQEFSLPFLLQNAEERLRDWR